MIKNVFENVIKNGEFELKDMLMKIDEAYIKSQLSKDEKEKLEGQAREKANPVNSYADTEKLLEQIFGRLEQLENRIYLLEHFDEEVTLPEPEPETEYLEYVQPTGAHDAYKIGDKIMYYNKKYVCLMNGCVWDPITYPPAWEEVK